MRIKYYILLSFLLFSVGLFAQPKIKLDTFARGYAAPIDIANDGFTSRVFVMQQNGIIWTLDSVGNKLDTFIDLRTKVQYSLNSEEGLLGLAFHPDFQHNGYFYTYYTKKNTTDNLVARYKVSSNPNKASKDSELIVINFSHPGQTNHNGGCIKFGKDGYLYIATGDGGGSGDQNGNAQNKNSILGKMLRIDVNRFDTTYTIPASNPFVGQANVKQEIWAYGLRNPWRYSFDKETGDLWLADVGQNAVEEVDFHGYNSPNGENYGWRCYEGNSTFNSSGCVGASNYKFPFFTFPHNNTTGGFAVTGGFIYKGSKYPDLRDYYIFADYVSGNFWLTKKTDTVFTTVQQTTPKQTNISSFGEDIRGELYATNLSNGVIYKIRELCSPFKISLVNKTNPSCSNVTNGSAAFTSVGANGNVTYNWSNGNSGATISNLAPNKYVVTATDGIGCVRKDSVTLYNADTLDKPIIMESADTIYTATGFAAYQWKRHDTNISGATQYFYIYNISGNYRVEITDINGCKVLSDNFSAVITGIKNKNTDLEKFSLFPNPVNDNLTIDVRFNANKKSTLKIINTVGQVVYTEQLQGKEFLKNISLQQFAKGLYQLSIFSEDGKVISKNFVKE